MSESATDGPGEEGPGGDGTVAGPSWKVPTALDGERVDRTVALLTGLTRSLAADLVSAGRVRVGRGAPVRSGSRRVHQGERLRIDGGLGGAGPLVPEELADPSVTVPVLHVDNDVIVVDKPAGLVVHPGAGHARGTLVQGLVAAYPDLMGLVAGTQGDDALRPGIVHRLDRGTSGLLVVARSEAARLSLVAQLTTRAVERRYRALAAGTVAADEGLIDAPLGRSTSDPTKRAVRADGREARTRYSVVSRFESPLAATLLQCRLETGRTHQIRVHLAAIGHPLIGDGRYGGVTIPAGPPGAPRPVVDDRPWLHAETLGFDHPRSGERLTFHSPLPPDLVEILGRLEGALPPPGDASTV
ncbi:MAG: RluA family pseudouridine synthase [Actinomycetota bacterium]|nr:RluA family pseudouridine synthase [Actinomycetota bacterium]